MTLEYSSNQCNIQDEYSFFFNVFPLIVYSVIHIPVRLFYFDLP